MTRLATLAALVSITLIAPQAVASWTALDRAVLADEADLIVRGEIVKLMPLPAEPGWQYAMIRVDETLRDSMPRGDGQPARKQVKLRQRVRKEETVDLRYNVGTSGVWMVTCVPSAGADVYRVVHPGCLWTAKPATVRALLESRGRVPAGAAVAGLRARFELAHGGANKDGRFRLRSRISLQNMTDKPITFVYWRWPSTLRIRWDRGEVDPLAADEGRKRVRTTVVIPPKGIRHLGYSLGFRLAEVPAGTYSGSAQLSSDGCSVEGAWRGELVAPRATITIK